MQAVAAFEALMLNHKGEVAECTGDNIFYRPHRGVAHPSIDAGILEVTATLPVVIELAKGRRHRSDRTDDGPPRHLYRRRGLPSWGLRPRSSPWRRCDGRLIGDGKPGPITLDLIERLPHAGRGPRASTHAQAELDLNQARGR